MKIITPNRLRFTIIFTYLLTLISCSKDSDLFLETILEEDPVAIEESTEGNQETTIDETSEIRSNDFSTINDAHVESGKGFDQTIIRLEEGKRTSYLMFDLSPISAIDGVIKKTSLQFTIASDDGYGPITIFKGQSNDWTEEELTQNNAPKIDLEVGSITADFKVGNVITLELDAAEITATKTTLILHQQNGNDFAFASKEHTTIKGPKLIVEYETDKDTEALDMNQTEAETATETNSTTETEATAENQAPIAIADAPITTGTAPFTVNFTGAQSTDDNGIVSYSWDFKDGNSSSEANPTHIFEQPGTYEISLTVTDTDGATATDVDVIIVNAPVSNEGSSGNYPANAVYASTFGYNAADATEAFKDAINSNHDFIVIDKQSSDWVIAPSKFFDISNKTIVFEPGVILKAKSGVFTAAGAILFQLVRPQNLIIEGYGATLKMNKSEYTSGEGRHAFSIHEGNNVTIKGLTFRDSGGDGIYLTGGSSNANSYAQNITIEDVVCTNNKRQGMSIISAQDVWVRNSEFSNSNGISPESGVDLEPNRPEERLVNINFSDCTFKNNDSHGFVIGTNKLTSASLPISVMVKDCHFENNSISPPTGAIKAELLLSQGTHNNPVKGTVLFERLNFTNSNHSIIFSKLGATSYTATFKDCTATNVGNSNPGGLIELQASSVENTLGGFTFDNFYMEFTADTRFMKILAPRTSGFQVKNITGSFTLKEPNDNDLYYTGGYDKQNNLNVNINYQHID